MPRIALLLALLSGCDFIRAVLPRVAGAVIDEIGCKGSEHDILERAFADGTDPTAPDTAKSDWLDVFATFEHCAPVVIRDLEAREQRRVAVLEQRRVDAGAGRLIAGAVVPGQVPMSLDAKRRVRFAKQLLGMK